MLSVLPREKTEKCSTLIKSKTVKRLAVCYLGA